MSNKAIYEPAGELRFLRRASNTKRSQRGRCKETECVPLGVNLQPGEWEGRPIDIVAALYGIDC